MHFCFQNAHLQEVADKLFPRLQVFLKGNIGFIKDNNDTNLIVFEALLLLTVEQVFKANAYKGRKRGLLWTPKVQNII